MLLAASYSFKSTANWAAVIRNSWLKLRFALTFLHIFNYVLVHGRTANFSFSLLSATCAYLMGGFYFPRESALYAFRCYAVSSTYLGLYSIHLLDFPRQG